MPGVNWVQPRVQGGLLDTVLKGVTVARDVYGIKADMARTDATEQATAQNKQTFDDQQANNFTQKEVVGLGKNYDFVDKDTPNAMRIGIRNAPAQVASEDMVGPPDSGVRDAYILPHKETSPMLATVNDAIIKGKHGTASYDLRPGGGGLLNFVETAKPEKPERPTNDRLMTVQDVDENGDPVTKVVPMVAGATYSTTKGKKPGADEEKVYTEMVNKIATPRGNQNVQQAQSSLRSIANAQELINQYPDLNTMPPSQVALLNQELAKVASGGVGSEHGQRSLEANTLAQKWAQLKQTVGNEPTGADLGAFVQQNSKYLAGLQKVNQAVVNKYALDIYGGYKNRLSDELNQRFQAEHGDLFQGQPGAQNVAGPVKDAGGFVGTANAGSGAAPLPSHPQDEVALKWAQAHLLSPNADEATSARQIIQANGGK